MRALPACLRGADRPRRWLLHNKTEERTSDVWWAPFQVGCVMLLYTVMCTAWYDGIHPRPRERHRSTVGRILSLSPD